MIDYGYNQIEIGLSDTFNITEADVRNVLQGIVDLGGSRVRIMVPWDMVEQSRGVYNLTNHDATLDLCEEYGLAPLLFMSVGPNWFGLPNMPTWVSTATYGELCGHLAQRYGPAGTGQVNEFEIWNEANSVAFSPWQRNPEVYAKYLTAAYGAIKAVHPSSTVISVGTMAVGTDPGFFRMTMDPLEYIKGFYAAGAGDSCDAVGFHWYNNSPDFTSVVPPGPTAIWWLELLALREFLVEQGHEDKKVWLTEIGVPYPGFTMETCVDYLKTMVDQIVQEPWLGPFFIYGQRNTGLDLGNHINQYGMVDFGFVKKQPLWDYAASIASLDPEIDLEPPTAPTSLEWSSNTTSVTLSWDASTDDVGVTGYRVYRDGVRVDTVTELTFTDSPLPFNSEYDYYVTAIDARLNESDPTDTVVARTELPDVGDQALYEYDFTGTGSFKPTTVFTDFGLGYAVSGSVANHNVDTAAGYKYSGGIYKLDQLSPDHFAEVVWAANTDSGDRSNMAIVRSDAAGDNFVYAVGMWSSWTTTFGIATRIAGVHTERRWFSGTGLFNGDRLRLHADDNVYTLYVIRANGVVEDPRIWVDEASVFPGASNLRTGFGYRFVRSGGVNWNAPGIKGLWRGHDLRATVNITINPPAMTATAGMLAPEIDLMSVTPPAMVMTASMPTPSLSVDVSVAVPVMAATASMPAPVVGVGTWVTLPVPAMAATASMAAPTLTSGVTISPPAMSAIGSMPTPVVTVENPPAIAFDAVGEGDSLAQVVHADPSPAVLSWAHDVTEVGLDVVALVGISGSVGSGNSSFGTYTRAVTFGGVPMTSLGVTNIRATSNNGFVELYALLDPPTGEQTVEVTLTRTLSDISIRADSVTYTGVSDVVVSTVTMGSGTSSSQPVTSTEADSRGVAVIVSPESMTSLSGNVTSRVASGSTTAGDIDRFRLMDLALDNDAVTYWTGQIDFGFGSSAVWGMVSAALIPA